MGSWRRGIRFSEGNLFGFGDRLGGEYVNTEGSNAVDLSYSVPITARNTTIDIRGGVTSTEVVEEPFDRADIIGDSFNFEFGVRQPIYRTPTTEISRRAFWYTPGKQYRSVGTKFRSFSWG